MDSFGADALEQRRRRRCRRSGRGRGLVASSPRSSTMSVAPNSRARAWRAGCREGDDPPGAEARAASTRAEADGAVADDGDRVAGASTPAHTAAWWPVPMTSDRVSSERSSARRSDPGRDRDEACRRRAARGRLALAAVDDAVAAAEPAERAGTTCSRRAAVGAGAVAEDERRDDEITLATPVTSAPTSSTTPMNSWPIRTDARGATRRGRTRGRSRTRRRATPARPRRSGASIRGSGRSPTEMSRGPLKMLLAWFTAASLMGSIERARASSEATPEGCRTRSSRPSVERSGSMRRSTPTCWTWFARRTRSGRRASGPRRPRPSRPRSRRIVDAMGDVTAFVSNGRLDVLYADPPG